MEPHTTRVFQCPDSPMGLCRILWVYCAVFFCAALSSVLWECFPCGMPCGTPKEKPIRNRSVDFLEVGVTLSQAFGLCGGISGYTMLRCVLLGSP